MDKQLTAVYETRGEWVIAYLEEIPGVNTQGTTKEEARANLEDALMEFLKGNRELSKRGVSSKTDVTEEPFGFVECAA
jgi:predicted RNase H-like HicB family nuclease